jgi:hypothetical protein
LRNDIPTSSQIVTLEYVILAWIHKLKYFARKMLAINAKNPIAPIINQTIVVQGLGFACASNAAIVVYPQMLVTARGKSPVA